MARDRSDTRWQHMTDPALAWVRLKWARETLGRFANAEAFASAAKVSGHYYRAHERDPDGASKHLELSYDNAVKWADLLDVRWQWILRGEGLPWRDDAPSLSAEARDVGGLLDRFPEEERKAKAAAIKALLTGTG